MDNFFLLKSLGIFSAICWGLAFVFTLRYFSKIIQENYTIQLLSLISIIGMIQSFLFIYISWDVTSFSWQIFSVRICNILMGLAMTSYGIKMRG